MLNPPNKPCACGSGRKQKKCHPFGAPQLGPEPEPRKGEPRSLGRQSDPMLFLLPLTLMLTMGGMRRF